MVKMTNREMLGILNCSIFTQNLPAKISYFFAMLKKKMEDPVKVFNDERRKVAEKYCQRDNNGNPKSTDDGGFIIEPESRSIVSSEIETLLDIEIEVNVNKMAIGLDRIEELNLNMTADDLLLLMPVVDFMENDTGGK